MINYLVLQLFQTKTTSVNQKRQRAESTAETG